MIKQKIYKGFHISEDGFGISCPSTQFPEQETSGQAKQVNSMFSSQERLSAPASFRHGMSP